MIQRVQSIYLFLSALSCFGLYKLPFAQVAVPAINSDLFKDGAYTIQDNTIMMMVYSLAGLLALGAIFLFKNRGVQIKMVLGAIVTAVVGSVLTIMDYVQDPGLTGVEIKDGYGIGLPVFAIIFALAAIRFIRKDSELVRSMDRLR